MNDKVKKEKEFEAKRKNYDLVTSDVWREIRKNQLELIIDCAKNNYDGNDIRAMLKLIAKTDEWKKDFETAQKNRK
jgi:hypothetical protein